MWTEVGLWKCFYKDIRIDVKCSGVTKTGEVTAKISFTIYVLCVINFGRNNLVE